MSQNLPDKKTPTTSIRLNAKKEWIFSSRTITNSLKKHFANLAGDLVKKLADPTEKFGIPSVRQQYEGINLREKNLNLKMFVQCQC